MEPDTLLDFWFDPEHQPRWFRATPDFDQAVRDGFETAWQAARSGQLDGWAQTPDGALALVILLDQMPLNMFRGQPESFATEALARQVARRAIEGQFDRALSGPGRAFLYMPFMHSEDLADQERSLALHEAAGLADNLRFARHHHAIVQRFGRFPHRNAILGRTSTPEEQAWLASAEAFHG